MSMHNLMAAFELIKNYNDEADFEGPKSEDLIARAEVALELILPPTYRAFLQQLGCGDIAGFEVYGLIGPDFFNSSIPNGIWLTLNERNSSNLPRELVLIAETGEGTYYAINTCTANSDGENPVVEWSPNISKHANKLPIVAEDFGEFFLGNIENMLAD